VLTTAEGWHATSTSRCRTQSSRMCVCTHMRNNAITYYYFSIGVNTSDIDQHTALANRCHVGDLPLVPATQRHIDKQTHMPIIPAVTQNLPQQRTCCHSKTATIKNMPQLRALLCPIYETLSYQTTKQSEMATNTLPPFSCPLQLRSSYFLSHPTQTHPKWYCALCEATKNAAPSPSANLACNTIRHADSHV
jgi:hypothetical protein